VRPFVTANTPIEDIVSARKDAAAPLRRCLRHYLWYRTGVDPDAEDPGPVPQVGPILLLGLGVSALTRLKPPPLRSQAGPVVKQARKKARVGATPPHLATVAMIPDMRTAPRGAGFTSGAGVYKKADAGFGLGLLWDTRSVVPSREPPRVP
jgi:hypothetical protein